MSGPFESVRWNACEHRLDLGSYSHTKEFWGNGVRTHVNFKGKIPSTGKKKSPQRRIESTTLHQAGQRAQDTTSELIRPQVTYLISVCWLVGCLCNVPEHTIVYQGQS